MTRPTRPRLRTKTGCLPCRKQRKKCDETKPTCRDCSHYRRVCLWPTVFADRRHGRRRSVSRDSASMTPTTSPPLDCIAADTSSLVKHSERPYSQIFDINEHYNPYGHISWHPIEKSAGPERLLFHHFSTCTLPTAISAHARPVYATYKDVYQIGFQKRDIMNVFLGIAALRIGQNSDDSFTQATALYTPSINALYRSIKEREVDGTEEWLLVLVAFMVIFETSRFDLSSHVMLHLGGLAQLFRIRNINHALPDYRRPFHRIAAESFAYHLASYSLLYASLDCIAQQFTWADLDGYYEIMPCPEASKVANSPILGSHSTLFKIIFEVTRLSRHTPLGPSMWTQAMDYKRQLDAIQIQLTQLLDFADGSEEHESHEGALLYTLTTQLFLFKVMNPSVDTEDRTIKHVLSQALLFVDKCRIDVSCNSYFCWPLTVLACAVSTEEGKELIERKMAETRRWTPSGQIYRTESIINAIWEDDSGDHSGSITLPRGLDRLLHKEGLLDTLLLSK